MARNGVNGILVQCPKCNYIGDLDDFDVLGADEGKLFCNNCNAEVAVIELDCDDKEVRGVPKQPPVNP